MYASHHDDLKQKSDFPLFKDEDECSDSPCADGSTCNNFHGRFNCSCTEGYEGKLCQDGDIVMLFKCFLS